MALQAGITRGRTPAVNAYVRTADILAVPDGTNVNIPEVNCGVNAGVNLLVWMRQVQGAVGATVTIQYLWRVDPPTNANLWRNVIDPYVIPVGGTVSRVVVQHPARRFRVNVSAPGGGGPVSVEYEVATWAL